MNETYYDEGAIDYATLLPFFAFMFAVTVIVIVAQWKIFQKAGQPGWASLVPIYNVYVTLKIVGKPGYWILLMLIPFVNIYFGIKTVHLLSKSFGKDVGFTLGLLFLPFIFYPILGFGSARYEGPYGDSAAFEAYQNQNRFSFENTNA
jgi:hypothetical protein